jgi:hypothetical protein
MGRVAYRDIVLSIHGIFTCREGVADKGGILSIHGGLCVSL